MRAPTEIGTSFGSAHLATNQRDLCCGPLRCNENAACYTKYISSMQATHHHHHHHNQATHTFLQRHAAQPLPASVRHACARPGDDESYFPAPALVPVTIAACSSSKPVVPAAAAVCAGGGLSPPDTKLLVQQGGTLVFKGTDVIFRHNDSGILKYTDIDALMAAIDASRGSSTQQAQLTTSSSNSGATM